MRPFPRGLAALSLAVLGVACSDDGAVRPKDVLTVSASGWLESGALVRLEVRSGDVVIPPTEVTWSSTPTGVVTFLPESRAHLLAPGTVRLHATRGGATGSTTVEVGTAPLILFDDRVDGNRDVFQARLDGSAVVPLTLDPADDADPTAAGGRVVFSSLRDGNAELYRLDDGAADPTRITNTDSDERQPALSNDGSRVAFARSDGGGNRIWTASADGGSEARLTDGLAAESAIEASPSWSPEGTRVVLMSTAGGNADIWSVADDGSGSNLLAGTPEAEVEPAFHPMEDRVVYVAVVPGEGPDLFLTDPSTESVIRLTHSQASEGQPAWLPDGRIVFTEWTEGGTVLRWLDPADPELIQDVPLAGHPNPQNPTGIHAP